MAVATATTAINMSNWKFFSTASYPIANSTHIQENGSGGAVVHYYGNGFTFSGGGDITGGTLTRVTQTAGSVLYNVTGLSHDAVQVDNLIEGANENTLFAYLFGGNDTFNGSSFADTLNGHGGKDTMNGRGGSDRINGGSGNDVLIWGAGDTFNGGSGTDTLKIVSGNVNLVALENPNNRLLNLEQIDLRPGNHLLKLNKSDVLDMSPTDQVKVFGDAGDTVDIASSFTEGATSGGGYTTYNLGGGVKLLIHESIDVM